MHGLFLKLIFNLPSDITSFLLFKQKKYKWYKFSFSYHTSVEISTLLKGRATLYNYRVITYSMFSEESQSIVSDFSFLSFSFFFLWSFNSRCPTPRKSLNSPSWERGDPGDCNSGLWWAEQDRSREGRSVTVQAYT